jgi:hypothetical protein
MVRLQIARKPEPCRGPGISRERAAVFQGRLYVVKTIKSEKAKQGRWGVQVLLILIIALVLAVIVWGGVEFYGEKIHNPQPGKTVEQNG